ncbi:MULTISPECIES: bifunctional phosphoglucose/phosphomannose isomerase [Thermomonospora]|uniref:Mannose-6-phosphate isomerase n=1 Tax=Thermomonospora curvata (strain ATCC 19995 / DSM 43183 / JCM 3096 / KCTC 9072 / NBRC 15933 / NCIMB 10081 / Henssen B9) TaxID=471852 RepID=D1AF46_THECD|nr:MULTISPECIES: bifunctional phosphoglucose/phosphomannose isomerase [Thermomonospora]ACY99590.1 Mannose-6-phosphate isomerase [Thermomonospora curvata DSM 43183]
MSVIVDSGRLDDPQALAAADPGDMLRQVASSAAQVRQARYLAGEAGLERLAEDGRPRAVVVAGMGGSGISGDVLAAVCGVGCPVPIVTVRGYRLPGWVGAADLVIAVSCSGTTEETLLVAAEAMRRGCRMLMVGGEDSPLAELAARARAPFVPVRSAGQPRSTLWGLSIPLVLAARELGLTRVSDEVLEATARRLEEVAYRCRPTSESFVNPAKQIALDLAGELPMVWGSSELAATVAYRMCCQLNENAKYPAVFGGLPEANHNQVVAFDGFFAGGTAGDIDDFFRDRAEEAERTRLHLVMLRDADEHPQVVKRREISAELARERGIAVTEITAEGVHPLERIASLIAMSDYVTVYLAIALGVDPTPVSAIQELKARIA